MSNPNAEEFERNSKMDPLFPLVIHSYNLVVGNIPSSEDYDVDEDPCGRPCEECRLTAGVLACNRVQCGTNIGRTI